MPILDAIIPETTKQIIEPVSEQISRRLISILGLSGVFKDSLFITSDDLRVSNFNNENNDKRISDNRCDVAIVPNYNPMASAFESFRSKDTSVNLSSNRSNFGEYPVFSDPRSNIYTFEVSVPCSVEMNFTMKFKSIELADLASNAIFSKVMTSGTVYDYNDISFSYPLPDRFIIMLHRMFSMQDDLGVCANFPNYLKVGSNSAISILVNRDRLDRGSKEIVVLRNNVKVLGRLDYAGDKPEPDDINKVSDRYSITFTYSYQFSRPAIVRLSYPIMINNQLLDRKFTRKPQGMNLGADGQSTHYDSAIGNYFIQYNKNSIDLSKSYPLVKYPDYDDWNTGYNHPVISLKYQTIFIGLMSLDVNTTDGTLSLSVDLRNEVLPLLPEQCAEEIEKVIALKNGNTILNTDILRRLSIFDISVFSNDNVIMFDELTLSDGLILSANSSVKLDISKRYRIVISQIKDIAILSPDYVYYMLENPTYYTDFLISCIDYLVRTKYIQIVQKYFDKTKSISALHKNIQSSLHGGRHGTGRATTLGKYIINVRR